jgi:proton glutamate symport protein
MPKNLTAWIGVAIVAGLVAGLASAASPGLAAALSWLHILGDVFVAALKMLVVPVILSSLVVGTTSIGDLGKVGRLGGKAAVYYLCTTGIAIGIGLLLVNVVQPGVGADLTAATMTEQATLGQDLTVDTLLRDFLVSKDRGAIRNPFDALATGNVLGIILFALLLGGAITAVGERGQPLLAFFRSLDAVVMKVIDWVMWLAPLGVFVLLQKSLATGGLGALKALAAYSGTVMAALALHGLVALPLIVRLVGGMSPIRWLRGIRPALAVALSTASSSATLPVTIEACEENLDVPPPVASFVLPLGATMNMDGTALYEAIAALFVAQAYGIDLGAGEQLVVFVTAAAASVGAAGIPSAGLVTMAMVFTAVGLPLEGIGLILAVDRFLDMFRTTVNVMGDTAGAVVVTRYSQT